MNSLFGQYVCASAHFALAAGYPSHAPLWVFIALGSVVGIVVVVLYFATSVGGGEQDYLYADPSNNYFGSPGGPWNYRGLGGYGGFGGL